MGKTKLPLFKHNGVNYLLPFIIIITACFALWGFANDITNPMGSLMGMFVAMNFIQARLNPMSTAERALLPDGEFEAMKQSDLSILIAPYLTIGLVVLAMFLVILLLRMPKNGDADKSLQFGAKCHVHLPLLLEFSPWE